MTTEEFKQEAATIRLQLANQARRYLGDADEAEDVVQDALLRLWLMHSQLEVPMERMAAVVVRNLCIDHLRRQKSRETVEQLTDAAQPAVDERIDRVLAIIDTLPPLQQTILRLRHMEGMELRDIAALTGSSEVAVRKVLSRARQAVRLQYMKRYDK